MDSNLTNMLLDSLESTVINTVERAGYNRTIQAIIVKCIDATIGQYQCKYQDSNFYAYSEDVETTYSDNTEVYVLIPNNDFNGDKRIIGSVKKLGINYIGEIEEENYYDIEGNSLIDSSDFDKTPIGLKSYKKDGDLIVLYSKDSSNNYIDIDLSMTKYILQSSTSLMIDIDIQTKLDKSQQFRGNYGLRLLASFENEADGAEVTKEFLFDVDKFTGNPYKYINSTRQYVFFPISLGKFIEIKQIEIYCKDFPNSKEDPEEDIFITNIKLFGASRMTEEELAGCAISFVIPQGSFFDETNKAVDKHVKAQVKLKGQLVNSNVQDIKYYWFREDIRTNLKSEYYNSLGGRGWRCLNDKNIIQAETEAEDTVVEWIPSGEEFIVTFDDATARENKFKCVVEYEGTTFSKEFIIKNMCDEGIFEVYVESDNGEVFYFDVGHLNLSCWSNYGEDLEYAWAKENREGYLEFLEETTEINEQVNELQAQLDEIYKNIEQGTLFEGAQQAQVDSLMNQIEALNMDQRVEGRWILNVNLSLISERATFKCSCYTKTGSYIGTGSITIKNKTDEIPQARVVINNGNQVFKYNENGIAPTNLSLETPFTIPALSYTIYDENDNEVPDSVAERCNPVWKVPNIRTMIKPIQMELSEEDEEENENEEEVEKPEFLYYTNTTLLTYDIESKYDFNKDINNIELTVDYKGNKLHASTNFLFTKIGDPGTNGTDYVFRLRVNSTDPNAPKVPVITIDSYGNGKINFRPGNSTNTISQSAAKILFIAELWKNGDLVTLNAGDIKWKMLSNKYGTNKSDESFYAINNTTGAINIVRSNLSIEYPANVVECYVEYEGLRFYASSPIVTVRPTGSNQSVATNYAITLKNNSGYQFVTYSSDGRNPTYNDFDPFEITVTKTINGVVEDVSLVNGDEAIDYNWTTGARILARNASNFQWERLNVPTLTLSKTKTYGTEECEANQYYAIPPIECDGVALTHAIWVSCENKGKPIGKIHIPVHLYLNRFGISSVNDWDGNSIQINQDGGYILSPQMGAGVKDNENKFTGVLMGEVKEANRTYEDIGLLGYNKGEKTFFLDSKDGSLVLGKKSAGRIYLNPSESEGLIYSDNFWNTDSYDEGGKLSSFRTENGAGMLINFTKPEILFGKMVDKYIDSSTNKTVRVFSVDKDGYLTANKGTLANFTFEISQTKGLGIKNEDLYSESSTMAGKLYTGNKSDISSRYQEGIYMDSLGRIVIGKDVFSVNEKGYLKSTSGKIAAFNFNDKLFYSDGKWADGKIDNSRGGFYLDASVTSSEDIKLQLGDKFWVTQDGTMHAKSGTLGNFTLTEEALYSKDNSNWETVKDGIFIDSSGWLKVGQHFKVDSSGQLTLAGVTVENSYRITSGGFSNLTADETSDPDLFSKGIWFQPDGKALFGKNLRITSEGTMTAKVGTIGGLGFDNERGIFSNTNSSTGKGFLLGINGNVTIGDSFSHHAENSSASADIRTRMSGWTLFSTMLQSTTNQIYPDRNVSENAISLNGKAGIIVAGSTTAGDNDDNTYWFLHKDGRIGVKKGTLTIGADNLFINSSTLPQYLGGSSVPVFKTSDKGTIDATNGSLKGGTLEVNSGTINGSLTCTGDLILKAGIQTRGGLYGLTGTYTDVEKIKEVDGILVGIKYGSGKVDGNIA